MRSSTTSSGRRCEHLGVRRTSRSSRWPTFPPGPAWAPRARYLVALLAALYELKRDGTSRRQALAEMAFHIEPSWRATRSASRTNTSRPYGGSPVSRLSQRRSRARLAARRCSEPTRSRTCAAGSALLHRASRGAERSCDAQRAGTERGRRTTSCRSLHATKRARPAETRDALERGEPESSSAP